MSRVTISYVDGREETVTIRPVGLIAAERHYKGDSIPAFESTCYAAWASIKPGVGFEEWLETLEDVNREEEAPPPPVPPPPEQ